MGKYYIFIAVLGIFVISILTVGFVSITNPFMEKDKKMDEKRENDLMNLTYAINDYYSKNGSLPKEIPFETTYSTQMTVNDPESKSKYEYKTVSDNTYELCAVFATDTTTKDDDSGTTVKSSIVRLDSNSNVNLHPKGRYCIKFGVSGYYPTPTPYIYPTSTPEPTPTPTFLPTR